MYVRARVRFSFVLLIDVMLLFLINSERNRKWLYGQSANGFTINVSSLDKNAKGEGKKLFGVRPSKRSCFSRTKKRKDNFLFLCIFVSVIHQESIPINRTSLTISNQTENTKTL